MEGEGEVRAGPRSDDDDDDDWGDDDAQDEEDEHEEPVADRSATGSSRAQGEAAGRSPVPVPVPVPDRSSEYFERLVSIDTMRSRSPRAWLCVAGARTSMR